MHVLPGLPHHAARRRHRLRPARARRQVQEDGGDRYAPGHAQELMPPRTNEPRTTLYTRFLILANWIGHLFWAHFAFLHLIGHQITSYFRYIAFLYLSVIYFA